MALYGSNSRLFCGPIHRDVRFSPYNIYTYRNPRQQISCAESLFSRKRASVGNIPRRRSNYAGGYPSYKRWACNNRLYNNVERLETDSRCKGRTCNRGAVCLCEASPVFRPFSRYDRHVDTMADNDNSPDVSCARLCVLPLIKEGRK